MQHGLVNRKLTCQFTNGLKFHGSYRCLEFSHGLLEVIGIDVAHADMVRDIIIVGTRTPGIDVNKKSLENRKFNQCQSMVRY